MLAFNIANLSGYNSNIVNNLEQRGFCGSSSFSADNPVMAIDIPNGLRSIMNQADLKQLEEADEQIQMSLIDMFGIFDPVVEQVIHLIETQFAQCKIFNVGKIFLVGGFAENDYLYTSIKNRFPEIQLVRPGNAGGAIMSGAVLLGLNYRYIHVQGFRIASRVIISPSISFLIDSLKRDAHVSHMVSESQVRGLVKILPGMKKNSGIM